MSAFEDFVNLELPKRPPMLTLANTGFDSDPNGGGVPAVIANAPQGTFFFRQTGEILYIKESGSPGTWAPVGASSDAQTAALTWNITTTGNDITGDGSVGLPFATPSGALAKFKALYGTRVRFLVDLLIGSGSFPGFNVQGWEMDPATNTTPVGFRFIGTWTVQDSGTWTGVTPGNTVADVVYARVQDTTKTWTVNQHQGAHVRFNTGTSALQILPILSNTVNELVLPNVATLGSVGGTYDIVVPGSLINTAVPIAPSLVAANASVQNPTPQTHGISVYNVMAAPGIVQIRFENLDIVPASAFNGINIQGVPCTFTRCRIMPVALTSSAVNVNGGIGTISVSQCVVTTPGGQTCINVAGTGLQLYSQNLINHTNVSLADVNISAFATVQVTNSFLGSASFGIPISGQGVLTLSGTTIDGNNASVSQLVRARVVEGGTGSIFINASSLALRNNPVSTGLEIQGPAFASITALFMSGSATAIGLDQGGRVKIGPTSIVTSVGGLGDVVLDGVPTTVANMRAQAPKLLINSYGTAIWE